MNRRVVELVGINISSTFNKKEVIMSIILFDLPMQGTKTEITETKDNSRRKIFHDIGIKIGGAKKDIRGFNKAALKDLELNPKEAHLLINKHNLITFDIEKEKERGVSSGAAYFKKKIINALCVRPKDDPESREGFITFVGKMNEAFDAALSVDAVMQVVTLWRKECIYSKIVGKRFLNAVFYSRYRLDKTAKQFEEENDWLWADKKKIIGNDKLNFTREVSKEVKRIKGAEITADSITEKMVIDEFGFRAVEFGNWISDKDAQYHIKNTLHSLYDLAEVLCLPPQMLSWNGKLAIAFGSRGAGKASAHYEPARIVINLTKFRGGGSLAHEMGHFFDHMLGDKSQSGKVVYASHVACRYRETGCAAEVMKAVKDMGYRESYYHNLLAEYRMLASYRNSRIKEDGHTENNNRLLRRLYQRYDEINRIRRSLNKTGFLHVSKFYNDAYLLGDYWVRDHELFARAFESYIEDKLIRMGRQNTYMVDGTTTKYKITRKGKTVEPYPQGEEREIIYDAFEQFFEAIRKQYCNQQFPLLKVA
jgi:hypothetical protein